MRLTTTTNFVLSQNNHENKAALYFKTIGVAETLNSKPELRLFVGKPWFKGFRILKQECSTTVLKIDRKYCFSINEDILVFCNVTNTVKYIGVEGSFIIQNIEHLARCMNLELTDYRKEYIGL